MRLKRRKPPRSGIARAPRREYPAHLQWLRGFECAVSDVECKGKVEAAHVRLGTDGGISLRPSDWFANPLCEHHHRAVQHAKGERTFEKTYQRQFFKGLRAAALYYAKQSPQYWKDDEFRAGVNKALEGK